MNLSTGVFKHQGLSLLPQELENLTGLTTTSTARISSEIDPGRLHRILMALSGWLVQGEEIAVTAGEVGVYVSSNSYRWVAS